MHADELAHEVAAGRPVAIYPMPTLAAYQQPGRGSDDRGPPTANFWLLLPPVLPARGLLPVVLVEFRDKPLKSLVGGDGLEPPTSCV